jgi:predicted N-acetyltransferase YhbS
VELIDLPVFGPGEFDRIVGGTRDAFGTDHLGIEWLEKSHHVGLMDDGLLVGHAGWVASSVQTAGRQVVEVLGLGGVIMHADYRGRGVGAQLVEGAMHRMSASGVGVGMLFCRPERLAFYGRLGWLPITDPVRVGQPGGSIVMPLRTCWTPLAEGSELPGGTLDLRGLPF